MVVNTVVMFGLAFGFSLYLGTPMRDPDGFLGGARGAFEMIVEAFAKGDRDTLRPLLAQPVMSSFEKAMSEREAQGRTEQAELPHPPRADLDHAEAEGDLARARVRFLAEIRNAITHDGVTTTEERRTAELWTFERNLKSRDPNWTLIHVAPAEA